MGTQQCTVSFKVSKTENTDKTRVPTVEQSFSVADIMAITTAGGTGKSPLLYVDGYAEPLALHGRNFEDCVKELNEVGLDNMTVFIIFGEKRKTKTAVNYKWVKTMKKTTGQILFNNGRTLQLTGDEKNIEEDIDEYNAKYAEIQNRILSVSKQLSQLAVQTYRKESNNNLVKLKKIVSPIEDSVNMVGCVGLLLSLLLIIMIILQIIILCKI